MKTKITTETRANGVVICSFPKIRPINTVEEGLLLGYFTDHDHFITNQTVPFESAEGEKKLYLVCFNRTIPETGYAELLRAEGKQPCRYAPNYLLGLMAKAPDHRMPAELRNKDFVAAEPNNPHSAFSDWSGVHCFLYVYRDGTDRKLGLARVSVELDGSWALLAEDLAP